MCASALAWRRLCGRVSLTICDLQLSFGEDAASHGQGLADVVAGVGPLHGRDGEVSAGGHGEATAGLLGLVGEQQVLEEQRGAAQLAGTRITVGSTCPIDPTYTRRHTHAHTSLWFTHTEQFQRTIRN